MKRFSGVPRKKNLARKSRFRPVPQAAAGRGPFEIHETPPGTPGGQSYPLYNSKATSIGSFSAPGGEDRVSKALRARSYGKLIANKRGALPKSAKTVMRHDKGIDPMIVDYLMDAHAAQYMRRRGVDEVDDVPFPDWSNEDLQEIPPHIIAGEALRHINSYRRSASFERAADVAREALSPEQYHGLFSFYHKKIYRAKKYNGREFADMAREFQQLFGPWPPGEAPWEINESDLSPEEKRAARRMEHQSGIPYGGKIPEYGEGDARWGEMAMVQLPLVRRNLVAMRALKPRANFIGAFKYPHRAHPVSGDGRAFGQKMKRPGGTILLDCSGSMSLSASDINELLTHAPAAVVAGYASTADTRYVKEQLTALGYYGVGKKSAYGPDGLLVLAARNGKMANHEVFRRTVGGGNEVDGEALRWLATMPHPRIWVSDGGVTGSGESSTNALIYDAMLVCRRNDIRQVLTVGDCIRLVKKMYKGEVGAAKNKDKKYQRLGRKA